MRASRREDIVDDRAALSSGPKPTVFCSIQLARKEHNGKASSLSAGASEFVSDPQIPPGTPRFSHLARRIRGPAEEAHSPVCHQRRQNMFQPNMKVPRHLAPQKCFSCASAGAGQWGWNAGSLGSLGFGLRVAIFVNRLKSFTCFNPVVSCLPVSSQYAFCNEDLQKTGTCNTRM